MTDSPPLLTVHCDEEEGGGRNEEEMPPKSEPPSKRPKIDHSKEGDVTTAAPRTGDKNNAHFLKEEDVGVTEYLTDRPGIFAILKQRFVFHDFNESHMHSMHSRLYSHRYSDFVVREIAADGCVARLTSYEIPQEQEQVSTPPLPLSSSFLMCFIFDSHTVLRTRHHQSCPLSSLLLTKTSSHSSLSLMTHLNK